MRTKLCEMVKSARPLYVVTGEMYVKKNFMNYFSERPRAPLRTRKRGEKREKQPIKFMTAAVHSQICEKI